jgi:Zn-dependent peptidase ImmA (M78 family)
MNDNLQSFVTQLRNYALEHHIGAEYSTELSPGTPSQAYPEDRFMIINMNWYDQPQVPFSIAHEIGHVEDGDAGVLYFTPTKTRYESAADRFAVRLLVPMYFVSVDAEFANARRFMDALHIPDYMGSYCGEIIADYYDRT